MQWPTIRIRTKIAVPFTVLFILFTLAASATAVILMSANLERGLRGRIDRVSAFIAGSDLAGNPIVLETLGTMTDAEIVTFAADGAVVASTPGAAADPELVRRVRDERLLDRLLRAGAGVERRDFEHRGRPHTVTYRPVRGRETIVALVVDTSDLAGAQRQAARTIGLLSLVSIVAMTLLAVLVARGITSPLERLVQHTRALAAGELDRRSPVAGRDEIGGLGRAFDEMAANLRQLEAKAVRSEKLAIAGQLAARVAHDVRNPLTAIKMRAQVLQGSGRTEAAVDEALAAILAQTARIERVIEGLLDLASPRRLVLEPREVNRVVDEALATAAAQLDHHRIEVSRRFAPGLPPVALDDQRLGQALLDLIQNAVEAMPAGGELTAETRAADGDAAVEISICDNGAGIAAADAGRVFDPFFTTKREGVGLGLVNAKSIVERHGGSIELRAAGERGACAVIRLPRAGLAASPGRGDTDG